MHIKQLQHAGWERNLQLINDKAELIISLDVGPRILSYKTPRTENVLKTYPEQLGKGGENEWMIRGGHRLWVAPEDEALTYVPDNTPVNYDLGAPNEVKLINTGVDPWKIKKEMTVSLAENTSQVTINHRITNEGAAPIEAASWGLSVMIPGGLEIIPLPPLGVHPRDLLPNRLMIIWPYTNLTDPRWRFGESFITLRQTANAGQPTKLGLAHKQKWIGYLTRDSLFIKTIDYQEGATYPDHGCNFETFTNQDMLEIESLSPLKKLVPGESVSHTEHWHLFGEIPEPHSLQEPELAAWLAPFLKEAGL
ncbi:MAG TPA: hypothetical protein VG733_10460 [Chthoniobacteraceae bacterium]|nr:hypothetical protein [Chthoniobacteraceae bacterium]